MVQGRPEGRLEVQVVAGRNMPRRSRFGRGDSFVAMTLGTSTKQTQVDKKGGAAPQWNDRLSFLVSGLGKSQLHVTAFEMESSVSQKKIGSTVVDLTKIFIEEEVDGWYTLTSGEKSVGDIYIEFTFTPKGGRKRPSKAHMEDDEEDMPFRVEPKQSKSSDGTVASAPAMMQQGSRPHTVASIASTAPMVGSAAATAQLRPSMSDLRPYSSASMHTPELANKYAQMHGKKPLPAAPNMSVPVSGFEPGYPSGLQPQVSEYDQTMMPGQLPFVQMQQRPMSYGGETLQMQYQGTMAPVPISGQPQQQHLMTLFAPPGGPDQPPMVHPDPSSQNPAYNPAYNPAFNPAYNPAYNTDPGYNPAFAGDANAQMAQQQPPGNSSLSVPLIAENGRPISAMSVAPQPVPMSQMAAGQMYVPQQPVQYTGYGGDGQQQMQHGGYAYGSMPVQMTIASPEMYHNQPVSAYDPYMSTQPYAPEGAMSQPAFQPQYAQSLPQQQQQLQPQQQQFVQQQQPQMVYANVNYSQHQQPMVYAEQPVYVDQAGIPLSAVQGGYMPQQQHQQMYAPGNTYGGQTY
ncbi:hypothetical protein IWW50_005493 [Coemansia erecta]|nr:hypothetical protein GGF43_005012 [Coemansia sp. RSA 2618]KAJ2819328.1 hypothetical protein IWW50_005493 [Coemansia erecta]